MTTHSRTGASSMYRWSVCPGSVKLSEGIHAPESTYAEEGSDAHTLAAYCLVRNVEPGECVGQRVAYEGRIIDVTADMAEAVAVYVDHCREDSKPGDVDYTEHQFDLSAVHPGCFGTCDRVTWRPRESLLIVRDYKHGAGIPVYPVTFDKEGKPRVNPQLAYYGLGALLTLNLPARIVRLEVVQPRCETPDGNPVKHYDIDAIDLVDFRTDLKNYALATEAPDAPLVPGDHCRFCPAAAMACPAIKKKAQEVARMEFSSAPLAPKYDPQQLRLALDSIPVMEAWIKNVREFAYAEAEAGRTPPGYKLVAKRATRKWIDEDDASGDLRNALGVHVDIYKPRELLSPAQIEKIKGVKKGQFDHLTAKESSGHTLAPLDDDRPAVRVSAKDDFAEIPAFLDRRALPPPSVNNPFE